MIKNLCIIQARMGSTRLPNKVLMEVNGLPLLAYEVNRVKLSKKINKIVIATGDQPANNAIAYLAKTLGINCFKGSENDVLDRYYQCALNYPEYQNIIRITGDCPLIDPVVVDRVIKFFEEGEYDYASNIDMETFPDGMDVEVFTKNALIESAQSAKLASEREHVTQYIRKNDKFKKGNLAARGDYSKYRLTVDNQEDFEVIKFLIENCPAGTGYLDYIKTLEKNPEIKLKNSRIKRNEGLAKSLKEDGLY